MKNSDNHLRVVFHVGPYKTGSTSIQLRLSDMRLALKKNGVLYSPDFDYADMRLGLTLARSDGNAWNAKNSGWWFDGGVTDQDLTSNAEEIDKLIHTRLFSSETFSEIDGQKLANFLKPISFSTLDVILMIREPIGWLWSMFCQQCMAEVHEWEDFVSEHRQSKMFFVSELIRPWLMNGANIIILPIKSGVDVWPKFRAALGLPSEFDFSLKPNDNISPPMIESLYSMACVTAVNTYLESVANWSGSIPLGFIERALTDINFVARPFYEYAKKISTQQLLDSGVLLRGPGQSALDYRSEWLDDLMKMKCSPDLKGGIRGDLTTALDDYSASDASRFLVPVKGFRNLLPIDANWEVLLRLVATAIGMRYQGVNCNSKSLIA